MKDTTQIVEKLKKYGSSLGNLIIDHRVTVMAVIVFISVGSALLVTQDFIDIPRNEDRYNDESLGIRYKEIDAEILAEFQDAQQDGTIEVNSNFDPDRSNPFSE